MTTTTLGLKEQGLFFFSQNRTQPTYKTHAYHTLVSCTTILMCTVRTDCRTRTEGLFEYSELRENFWPTEGFLNNKLWETRITQWNNRVHPGVIRSEWGRFISLSSAHYIILFAETP